MQYQWLRNLNIRNRQVIGNELLCADHFPVRDLRYRFKHSNISVAYPTLMPIKIPEKSPKPILESDTSLDEGRIFDHNYSLTGDQNSSKTNDNSSLENTLIDITIETNCGRELSNESDDNEIDETNYEVEYLEEEYQCSDTDDILPANFDTQSDCEDDTNLSENIAEMVTETENEKEDDIPKKDQICKEKDEKMTEVKSTDNQSIKPAEKISTDTMPTQIEAENSKEISISLNSLVEHNLPIKKTNDLLLLSAATLHSKNDNDDNFGKQYKRQQEGEPDEIKQLVSKCQKDIVKNLRINLNESDKLTVELKVQFQPSAKVSETFKKSIKIPDSNETKKTNNKSSIIKENNITLNHTVTKTNIDTEQIIKKDEPIKITSTITSNKELILLKENDTHNKSIGILGNKSTDKITKDDESKRNNIKPIKITSTHSLSDTINEDEMSKPSEVNSNIIASMDKSTEKVAKEEELKRDTTQPNKRTHLLLNTIAEDNMPKTDEVNSTITASFVATSEDKFETVDKKDIQNGQTAFECTKTDNKLIETEEQIDMKSLNLDAKNSLSNATKHNKVKLKPKDVVNIVQTKKIEMNSVNDKNTLPAFNSLNKNDENKDDKIKSSKLNLQPEEKLGHQIPNKLVSNVTQASSNKLQSISIINLENISKRKSIDESQNVTQLDKVPHKKMKLEPTHGLNNSNAQTATTSNMTNDVIVKSEPYAEVSNIEIISKENLISNNSIVVPRGSSMEHECKGNSSFPTAESIKISPPNIIAKVHNLPVKIASTLPSNKRVTSGPFKLTPSKSPDIAFLNSAKKHTPNILRKTIRNDNTVQLDDAIIQESIMNPVVIKQETELTIDDDSTIMNHSVSTNISSQKICSPTINSYTTCLPTISATTSLPMVSVPTRPMSSSHLSPTTQQSSRQQNRDCITIVARNAPGSVNEKFLSPYPVTLLRPSNAGISSDNLKRMPPRAYASPVRIKPTQPRGVQTLHLPGAQYTPLSTYHNKNNQLQCEMVEHEETHFQMVPVSLTTSFASTRTVAKKRTAPVRRPTILKSASPIQVQQSVNSTEKQLIVNRSIGPYPVNLISIKSQASKLTHSEMTKMNKTLPTTLQHPQPASLALTSYPPPTATSTIDELNDHPQLHKLLQKQSVIYDATSSEKLANTMENLTLAQRNNTRLIKQLATKQKLIQMYSRRIDELVALNKTLQNNCNCNRTNVNNAVSTVSANLVGSHQSNNEDDCCIEIP